MLKRKIGKDVQTTNKQHQYFGLKVKAVLLHFGNYTHSLSYRKFSVY